MLWVLKITVSLRQFFWARKNIYVLTNMNESWADLIEPMGESFQDYSWIQDFEADFP